MRKRTAFKRIVALLLTVVMVTSLFPVGVIAHAEEAAQTDQVTVKPYYVVNFEEVNSDNEYVYYLPFSWVGTVAEDAESVAIQIPYYNSSRITTLAQKMKEDFNARPDGTRYFHLGALTDVFKKTVVDLVDFSRGLTLVRDWMNAFLAEYHAIGGKLDGISVDLEYNGAYSFYVQDDEYADYGNNNKNIYNQIVANNEYKTRIRPKLEDRGFQFYENPDPTKYPYRSEIWTMYRYDESGGIAACRNIWDAVISEVLAEYINEAALEPLLQYYPNATLSDYKRGDTDSWLKGMSDKGNQIGKSTKVGNTSNHNIYDNKPNSQFFEYVTDSATGLKKRTVYKNIPAYNNAVYEDVPFNFAMYDVNIHKRMAMSTEDGLINSWVAGYNYGTKYGNTPYYSETVLHVGLLDPKPFLGYVLNPKKADYQERLDVLNELMAELTRVAGASDRKPIYLPINWNGGYMLSGMYAGGRNIWRLTPDTTQVSLEDFKVKDKAPTFKVNGVTITFPQGRIIADGDVSKVGTCGYWIETPEDVIPVVTADANRYSAYPSFAETFDKYATGAFTAASVYPHTYWTVTGSPTVQEKNGGKVLALNGSASIQNTNVPQLITAGDSYALQQVWEVTFTLPSSNYGDVKLLGCTTSDGFRVYNGAAYYYSQYGSATRICNLTAGKTYTVKRELDFTGSTYKNSYYIYDANGTLVGSAVNKNMNMKTVTVPVTTITLSTSNATNAVLIDDYKLYPMGVTTQFEQYETKYGKKLTEGTDGRTEDTAYRLSWMNASNTAQVVKIYNGNTVIKTVEMAPGMDGVITGVVEASATNPVSLSINAPANTTLPQQPDYDNGDFTWSSYSEALGAKCIVANQGYATLSEAVAAAKDGQTISVLADLVLDAPIVINKSLNIVGGGNTVTLSSSFAGTNVISVTAGNVKLDKLNMNVGARTALQISGGTLNVIESAIAAENGTAIVLSQDAAKTATAVNVTGGKLTGTKAFYQSNTTGTPSENIAATITGAVVTGALETTEEYVVIKTNADGYYLHQHTVVDDERVNPTCVDTGLTEGKHCSVCNDVLVAQQTIPAIAPDKGHVWQNPTCVDPQTCTVCGVTEGEPLGHVYEGEVVPPSVCAKPGSVTFNCTVCGHSYTEAIVIPHTPGEAVEVKRVAATASTDGYYILETACTVCGQTIAELTETVVLPARSEGVLYYMSSSSTNIGSGGQLNAKAGSKTYFNVVDGYTVKVTNGSVPQDNYICLDYTGNVATLILKNATIKNKLGLALGATRPMSDNATSHNTNYNIQLIGKNSITATNTNYSGLSVNTNGDVTFFGDGSLEIVSNLTSTSTRTGGAIHGYGNVILNNTNVTITLSESSGKSHAIASVGGNIIVNGGTLNIVGWDDPSTSTSATRGAAIYSALYASKDASGENGNITVKGNADVSIVSSSYQTSAVNAAGTFTIEKSEFELSLAGEYDTYNKGYLFANAPVLNFPGGYTATASTSAGTYAVDTGLTAPTAVKYDPTVAGYKYFKVTYSCANSTEHSYLPVVTAPTCTNSGYTTYTCGNCGEFYISDYTDKQEHKAGKVQLENIVGGVCTESGSYDKVTYCVVCGSELSRSKHISEASGHKYETKVTAPTCTAEGYTTYTCSACGDTYTADKVAALGHKYETKVTAPTCTEDGYTTYTCSVCGDTYTGDEVAAKGHTPGAVQVENNKAATCEAAGSYESVTYCESCGTETSRETVTVPKLTHTYETTVTVPSCTAAGNITAACPFCGEGTVYTVPAAHVPGKAEEVERVDATATAAGYYKLQTKCAECGEVMEELTEVVELPIQKKFQATLYYLDYGDSGRVGNGAVISKKTTGTYWFSVGNYDASYPNNTYTKPVTDGSLNDNSDSYVKLDLSGYVPTLTLKNVNIKNAFGLTLGTSTKAGSSTDHATPYNVVLIGENTIQSTHQNYGPLDIITTGDVTISGEGSLKLIGNKGHSSSVYGGLITTYGNLILDNVDVSLELKEAYYKSHGIAALGGNITVKGGSLNIVGWDDPSTQTSQTQGEAIYSALYASKNAAGENGNITIDKSDVKIVATAYTGYDAVQAAGAFTLKDSDFELSLAGDATYNKGMLFGTEGVSVLPTLTYTNGYTAVASTERGTYATDTGLTVPAEDKTVTYDAAAVATYKYFKVTHNHAVDSIVTLEEPAGACATEQYAIAKCAIRGEEFRTLIDREPTGAHTPGEAEEVERVAATTSADGYYKLQTKCAVCGEVIEELNETVVLPARTPAFVYYIPKGGNSEVGSSYTEKISAGKVVYWTTSQADSNNPNNWYMVKVTDDTIPEDNYVKLDYTGDIAVLTLKNATIKNVFGLSLGDNTKAYSPSTLTTSHKTHYKVELIGENTIQQVSGTGAASYGGLEIITAGDVTFFGEGTLNLLNQNKGNTDKQDGGIITSYGNIIFDDVDVNITLDENYNKSNAIATIGGDITVKGGNVNITAWDDPDTTGTGNGQRGEAILSAFYAAKNASEKGGNVTIQDEANVTVVASPSKTDVVSAAGTFTIKNSTVELAVAGYDNSGMLFENAPVLELTDKYTVTASTEMATWTDGTIKTDPYNLVAFNAEDAATYRYLKITDEVHTHTLTKVEAVEATCIATGNIEYYVCDCGQAFADEAGQTALEKGAWIVEKADHTPANRTDCTVDTLCTVCGEVAIAAGDHTYGEQTDCTVAVNCETCGTEVISAKDHVYVDGKCECGAEEPVKPSVQIGFIDRGNSLELEGVVLINQYLAYTNIEGLTSEYIEKNAGILVWSEESLPEDLAQAVAGTEDYLATVKDAGYYQGYHEFLVQTEGIPAKMYNDTVYYRPYMIIDGEYQYGDMIEYGVKTYFKKALPVYKNDIKQISTLVGLLNYGAEAQKYFDYKEDDLVNADVEALLAANGVDTSLMDLNWDGSYIDALVEPTTEMTVNFANTDNWYVSRSLELVGAIGINYFVALNNTAEYALFKNSTDATFYFWDAATYNQLAKSGTALTKQNAKYTKEGVLGDYGYGWEFAGQSDGIYAKELSNTLYAALCVTDANGVEHCSGVIVFSPEEYTKLVIEKSLPEVDLTKWMVTYGARAKAFFG